MNTVRPLLRLFWLLVAACVVAPSALAQQQPVGRVEQAAGLSWAIPPGAAERSLARGDSIFEGESIVTASDGELLIRMVDDAVIAVRANTRFTVSRYQFAGRERVKESSSLLSITRGALRTVTGLIGRQNPRGFQVGTSTATIGVRGTDFETVVLEEDTPEAAAGTYQQVTSGATVVTDLKSGQTLEVSAGQVAFAALNIAATAQGLGLLKNVPAVFRPGRYDNLLQAAADLLQQQLLKQVPGNLRQFVPNLPGLFR
jgi:hypothetical protein